MPFFRRRFQRRSYHSCKICCGRQGSFRTIVVSYVAAINCLLKPLYSRIRLHRWAERFSVSYKTLFLEKHIRFIFCRKWRPHFLRKYLMSYDTRENWFLLEVEILLLTYYKLINAYAVCGICTQKPFSRIRFYLTLFQIICSSTKKRYSVTNALVSKM